MENVCCVNIENSPSKLKFRNTSFSVRKSLLMKHFRKSQSKLPKNFHSRENRHKAKCYSTSLQSPVQNLLIIPFSKPSGKKGGPRKQVHLWQVSKAFQLQYYLVKILQDNAFFTRLKIARRFLSSALS